MTGRLRRLWPRGYAFAIAGIAIGVAGLVALGAVAERISRFIEGGHRFVLGQISVAGVGIGTGAGFTAGGLLPKRTLEAIARVPGVGTVQAQVVVPVDPATSQLFSVNQELILGLDLAVPIPNRNYPTLPVARGRFLRAGDRAVTVLGADFAAARGLRVGDRVKLGAQSAAGSPEPSASRASAADETRTFEVVGLLERLLTAPDRFAVVPLEDARDLWLALDPTVRAVFAPGGPVGREDLNTGAAVGWGEGVDPNALAARLRREVPGVNVAPPGEVARQLEASTTFFTWLLAGVGGIGLLVGGLSLSNTVAASTFERVRDFGIKQALGATDAQLFGEVLRESLAVSLSGGVAGTALAWLAGAAVDARAAHAGQQLFLFSGRLLAFAVVFAAVLGAIAGAYATARILRVPPAEAIRRGA